MSEARSCDTGNNGAGMRIGDLSARTGVSPRLLRYYEEQGLLVSTRTPSGQRHYGEDHVRRVGLIRGFLAAGMSTRSIADMVPCMADPTPDKARRAEVTMEHERRRLAAEIENLRAAQAVLDDLIEVNRSYLARHRGARASGHREDHL